MFVIKIFWGQIIIVFLIVFVGVWGVMQWIVVVFVYQFELGLFCFEVFGWCIYLLLVFFWWWFSFDVYVFDIFKIGVFIVVFGGFMLIVVVMGMLVWCVCELKNVEIYGLVCWVMECEVCGVGLFGLNGVVFGRFVCDYFCYDGFEYVLCFVLICLGKGVGLVVFLLLIWLVLVIVYDIKGENWMLIVGFCVWYGCVLLFDLINVEFVVYNFLLEV